MAAEGSLLRKRTGKAATRSRSTTSSTTGVAPAEAILRDVDGKGAAKLARAIPVPPEQAPLFEATQQDEFLRWQMLGASPPLVCQQLGVSITSFLRTLAEDAVFAERVRQGQAALSQNVAARLYRVAIEGNVAAQRFYLQLRPPPEWSRDRMHDSSGEDLLPHELADQYRDAGLDVPPELEALVGCADGGVES